MSPPAPAGSLAARLVLLFVVGSAFIMAGTGYALFHAMRVQLESNDLSEMRGKAKVIEQALREVRDRESLAITIERLQQLPVGHPRLAVGVRAAGRWLLRPGGELAEAAVGPTDSGAAHGYLALESRGRSWLLHTVSHSWAGPEAGSIEVVLAVETTEIRRLLQQHALVATLVAILGVAASAVLAWFVAHRGLAPLAHVAARAGEVTARRLGDRLDLKHAPREVYGLADSINRMLERLEESFRTLEQFSADIAHELRTPVNNLLLQTQVTLSRPRSTEEYHDALHSNLEELERLQRMIADMLFLARADRGMIELSLERIKLRPEIESIAEYFEAAATEKGQRITIRGEGAVKADRLMVRRAVNNLLSNAVRYSPQGATIEISIEVTLRASTITVSNPGETIPPHELQRLFARFARRDVARGREVEGAGLGLAIVDSIMKLMSGTLAASAAAGRVVFSLHFPNGNIANS